MVAILALVVAIGSLSAGVAGAGPLRRMAWAALHAPDRLPALAADPWIRSSPARKLSLERLSRAFRAPSRRSNACRVGRSNGLPSMPLRRRTVLLSMARRVAVSAAPVGAGAFIDPRARGHDRMACRS
jgi:hypothetical protein